MVKHDNSQNHPRSQCDPRVEIVVKTTIKFFYDTIFFDEYDNADGVLKIYLFEGPPNQFNYLISFEDIFFINKNFRDRSKSNIKTYQVQFSTSLQHIGICLRGGLSSSIIGLVNIHRTKWTHWVVLYTKIFLILMNIHHRRENLHTPSSGKLLVSVLETLSTVPQRYEAPKILQEILIALSMAYTEFDWQKYWN